MRDERQVWQVIKEAVDKLGNDHDYARILELIQKKYGKNNPHTLRARKILQKFLDKKGDTSDQSAIASINSDKPEIEESEIAIFPGASNSGRDIELRQNDGPSFCEKAKLPLLPAGYEYVQKIAQGYQGTVWQVINKNMGTPGRYEAVKVLNRLTKKDLGRFNHEITTMAALAHPNIVTIYYADLQKSFFIMEYLKGGTLHDLMNADDFDLRQGLHTLVTIGKALHFAHENQLIHRDLKPETFYFFLQIFLK